LQTVLSLAAICSPTSSDFLYKWPDWNAWNGVETCN